MSVKRTGIIDASLREKISELMTFALTTPSEQADIFVNFVAHVNWIEIDYYHGGYGDSKRDTWKVDLPDSDDPELTTVQYVIDQIDARINEIKEAIK